MSLSSILIRRMWILDISRSYRRCVWRSLSSVTISKTRISTQQIQRQRSNLRSCLQVSTRCNVAAIATTKTTAIEDDSSFILYVVAASMATAGLIGLSHCPSLSSEQYHDAEDTPSVIARLKFERVPKIPPLCTTCCDGATAMSSTVSDNDAAAAAASPRKRFGSNLRRHQTIQKIRSAAVKQRTLESKYDVLWDKPLGEGSFGKVYLGTDKVTGEKYAIKKIAKQYTDNLSFQREMDALLHLRHNNGHPHICGLHENYEEGDYYYLVLDLILGGEMFDHLCADGAYSESDAARLIREVANALAFLHGIGIVHGDLKPENLMLSSQQSSDAVIKIVDFGCAQTLVEDENGNLVDSHSFDSGGMVNTPSYCPPEVLDRKNKARSKQKRSSPFQIFQQQQLDGKQEGKNKPNSDRLEPSFDMWALGVILYIMLTGVHPFDLYGNASDEEIVHQILSRQRPPLRNSPITAHLSKDAIGVIDNLIQWDPKKRLTAQELLQNSWVRGESARTKKIADSDKRLAAFRAFKTKLEAKVFAEIADMTMSDNDDDDNDELESEDEGEDLSLDGRVDRNSIKGEFSPSRSRGKKIVDSIAKRTSLIEMAFHSLDPQHKGYVTTADLRKLNPGTEQSSEGDVSSDSTTANKLDGEGLCLSGFSDLLSENMKNRYFPKGHIIYHEGDVGDVMYFLNSGSVEVYTRDGFSKTLRTPGDFFGEGALLHPNRIRSASIRCKTPIHAIEISREYFEKYLASDSNIKLNLREKDKSRKRQRAKTLLRVQQNMQECRYEKGDALFSEGDQGEELYILEEGRIDVSVQGHSVVTVQPGEMCGEHSLIFGKPRNTTAICGSENGCNVHILRARDFHMFLDSHPSMKESIRDICLRREFQKALCVTTKHSFPKNEVDLKKAFDVLDTNKVGSLNLHNIREMILKLDPNFSEADVKDILRSLDLDNSGKVSWAEFKRIFGIENNKQ